MIKAAVIGFMDGTVNILPTSYEESINLFSAGFLDPLAAGAVYKKNKVPTGHNSWHSNQEGHFSPGSERSHEGEEGGVDTVI